ESRVIEVGEAVRRLTWSPDGQIVVCGTESGRVEGRSISTGARAAPQFHIRNAPVERIAWLNEPPAVVGIDETGRAVLHRLDPPQPSPVVGPGSEWNSSLHAVVRAPAAFTRRGDRLFSFFHLKPGVIDLTWMHATNHVGNLDEQWKVRYASRDYK